MWRSSKWRIVLAVTAGTLSGGAVSAAVALRDGVVKQRVVRALSNQLHSDVTLGPLSVTLYPKAGTPRFSALTFRTEGAVVSVAGTYVQKSAALNLKGTARLQASLSRAVGGVKGFFLRAADPLFRRDGAGALIPITITGPHDAPKVTLDRGRLFRR